MFQYGAPRETRTLTPKKWLLRPPRLPVPPSGHYDLASRGLVVYKSLVDKAAGINCTKLFRVTIVKHTCRDRTRRQCPIKGKAMFQPYQRGLRLYVFHYGASFVASN